MTSNDVSHTSPAGGDVLVSVLVNNYNYGRFLREAVDSALAQTYPHVEVVVVDDGSTDDSAGIIASYGSRVRSHVQANAGQAAAINRGLRMVRGEIVVVLDADDVLFPDVVQRVVHAFRADPRCVRVQYRLQECDETGRRAPTTVPPRHWPLLQGDLSRHVARYRMFRSPPTSGNAWSVAALRRLPPVPEDVFRQYADRWFSELTTLQGTVRALDDPGGLYRLHPRSHHVSVGKGLEYFRTRIRLTEVLHEVAREVAAAEGVEGFPADVDTALDAAFLSWRVAARKLGDRRSPDRALGRLAMHAAWAAWRQPGQPLVSRIGRAAWVLGLVLAPPVQPLLGRLIAARYERGTR